MRGRLQARLARFAQLDAGSLREAWEAFVATRVLVWAVAIFAVLSLAPPLPANGFTPPVPTPGPQHPFGTWPGGGALDLIFAPLAQWDAGQYLTIVNHGYGAVGAHGPGPQTAFFPLYPMLVKSGSFSAALRERT